VYRVHDHRHTHADRVSLADKSHIYNAINIYIYIYIYIYISTCIHITTLNLTFHIALYFYSCNPIPQSVYSCSTSSDDYFKVTCCHTYRPQPIEHVREKHATDHTPQRQVEFPYTNIVRIVPRLPNSSANN